MYNNNKQNKKTGNKIEKSLGTKQKAIKRYLILYREHVSTESRRAPHTHSHSQHPLLGCSPPPISITSTGLGLGLGFGLGIEIGIQMRMGMTADGRTSRQRILRDTPGHIH